MPFAGQKAGLPLAVLLLLSGVLFGAGDANRVEPNTPMTLNLPQEGEGGAARYSEVSREMLTKTLVSLVLVVGLGIAVAWTTKRVLPRLGVKAGKEIRVLETTGLGPRKALHLVQVGSQQLLIGSTPEHISMLTVVHTGFGDVMDARLDNTGEPS